MESTGVNLPLDRSITTPTEDSAASLPEMKNCTAYMAFGLASLSVFFWGPSREGLVGVLVATSVTCSNKLQFSMPTTLGSSCVQSMFLFRT